jgi:hypothetical protein
VCLWRVCSSATVLTLNMWPAEVSEDKLLSFEGPWFVAPHCDGPGDAGAHPRQEERTGASAMLRVAQR